MISFLLKGILRDRSRSLFPIITVTTGVALSVFLYSWVQGVFDNMIRTNAHLNTGHLKVMTRAYDQEADQMPNDLAMVDLQQMLTDLRSRYPQVIWKPRIRFGGLLDIPDANGETREQGPVYGLAVNLFNKDRLAEAELLNLKKGLRQGHLPRTSGEILISDKLARSFRVNPGDTATLIGSTMFGGMAVTNFTVAGTIHFGMSMLDRGTIITDLDDIQIALNMDDAAGEVFGFFANDHYDNERALQIKNDFNKNFSNPKDEFSPKMIALIDQGDMAQLIQMSRFMWTVIIVLFVVVLSIVLWNAGLMSGLRRYGEIGVRLAIGEEKGHIYKSMLIESLMIGFIGCIFGTVIGLLISYFLQETGVDMSSFMKSSSVYMTNVVRARVTPASYFIGFIPGLLTTVIGTAISGIGIYRRQTSQLFKELEV